MRIRSPGTRRCQPETAAVACREATKYRAWKGQFCVVHERLASGSKDGSFKCGTGSRSLQDSGH